MNKSDFKGVINSCKELHVEICDKIEEIGCLLDEIKDETDYLCKDVSEQIDEIADETDEDSYSEQLYYIKFDGMVEWSAYLNYNIDDDIFCIHTKEDTRVNGGDMQTKFTNKEIVRIMERLPIIQQAELIEVKGE